MWGNPKHFLLDAIANRLAGIDEYLIISPEFPLLIGYKGTHYHDNNVQANREAKGIVTFRNLVDGSEISQTVVYEKMISRRVYSISSTYYSGKVDLHGKNVYINEDNTIYRVPISAETIAKSKIPFHLERPKIVTVDLSKVTKIPIKYQGKPESLRFEMEYSVPHVSVDGKTGVISIDGPSIWKQVVERTRYSPFPRSNEQFLTRLKTESMAKLQLDKSVAPVSIPICVKATADGIRNGIAWSFLSLAKVGRPIWTQKLLASKRNVTMPSQNPDNRQKTKERTPKNRTKNRLRNSNRGCLNLKNFLNPSRKIETSHQQKGIALRCRRQRES